MSSFQTIATTHPTSRPADTPADRPADTRADRAVPPARIAPVASVADRHFLNRFTFGWTPAEQQRLRAAGSYLDWFDQQVAMRPDAQATAIADWFPLLSQSPSQLYSAVTSDRIGYRDIGISHAKWVLNRRVVARDQLREVLADFWENHLHVSQYIGVCTVFRPAYGRMFRDMAFASFTDILTAAITHPCMGIYLSNNLSSAEAPNENLGRELLELHTVGRDAGYTEDEVRQSAYILTGYTVDRDSWRPVYNPDLHYTGRVSVLGFSDANARSDGRAVTARYLSYLAHHPATARRIAKKLAVRFCSDTPSANLIEKLAAIYLDNDTAILPVLRYLLTSEEFTSSKAAKVRTPDEDVVASTRALGYLPKRPGSVTNNDDLANALLLCSDRIGFSPFRWTRPDGRPDTADAWTGAGRFLGSFDIHLRLAHSYLNHASYTAPSPQHWMPADACSFADLVDNISRLLTGAAANRSLQRAATKLTGISSGERINRRHRAVTRCTPDLLCLVLDQPSFFQR